jgi:DNA-binding transcriptional ArsR family regulator
LSVGTFLHGATPSSQKTSCGDVGFCETFNPMVNHMRTLDHVFSALADPVRRRILQGLARGRAQVSEIASPFRISAPAISRHLRVLERTGLIRRRRRGRVHEIELVASPMRAAVDWLQTYRRFWESSLDALAAFLESPESSPPAAAPSKAKRTKQP